MKKIDYKKLLLVLALSVMLPASQAYAVLMPLAVPGDASKPWLPDNLTLVPSFEGMTAVDFSSEVVALPVPAVSDEPVDLVLKPELPANSPADLAVLESSVQDDLLLEKTADEAGLVSGTRQHNFWTVRRLMAAGILASVVVLTFVLLMAGSGHGAGAGLGGGGMGYSNIPPIIPGGGDTPPVFVPNLPDPNLPGNGPGPNDPIIGGGGRRVEAPVIKALSKSRASRTTLSL